MVLAQPESVLSDRSLCALVILPGYNWDASS